MEGEIKCTSLGEGSGTTFSIEVPISYCNDPEKRADQNALDPSPKLKRDSESCI